MTQRETLASVASQEGLSAASAEPGKSSLPQRRTRLAGSTWRLLLLGGFLALVVIAGYFSPLPYDPTRPGTGLPLERPSLSHWFGTDSIGMDVFSRTIRAAATDVPLALLGVFVSLLIAIPLGMLASSRSAWAERSMRVLDAFQAFPLIILALSLVSLSGQNLFGIVLAMTAISTPRFIRLIRSDGLVIRESRFVEASIAMGSSQARAMFRHVLPNIIETIGVQAAIAAAQGILLIGSLGFLGVGIAPPKPSWGVMIHDGQDALLSGEWWVVVFPGLAILCVVAAMNGFSDALQDHAGVGRLEMTGDGGEGMHRPVVETRGLSIEYGAKEYGIAVVSNVSLSIKRGEFLAVLGESGSGKSTLARAILGLTGRTGRITSGSVLVDGQDILSMKPGQRRSYVAARIGYVPQNPFASLNPVIRLWRQFADSIPGSRETVLQLAAEILTSVGIREPLRVLNGFAHQLSGGMAQRVVIGLALAQKPGVIIADEPTTALDVLVQRRILDLFQELTGPPRNIGLILVTHNIGLAKAYAARIAVMHKGGIVEAGPTRQVLDAPSHWYTRRLVNSTPKREKPSPSEGVAL